MPAIRDSDPEPWTARLANALPASISWQTQAVAPCVICVAPMRQRFGLRWQHHLELVDSTTLRHTYLYRPGSTCGRPLSLCTEATLATALTSLLCHGTIGNNS